jgi:rhodanese-related sulfurtransferase/polyisoprenoid-binding protein YceI
MKTSVTANELMELLQNGAVTLIDVMLPEDFAAKHIPGAMNACVYEMVFLDRISECVTDRNQAIVVYDDSGTTMTARTAREKLVRAGFLNVAFLEGGQQAWLEAGFASGPDVPLVITPGIGVGSYIIDVEKSVIEWSGRNITNRHHGRIAISEGMVEFENGRPVAGRFVLDMRSITNLDLHDTAWRDMLLRHLMSDDFFDVAQYPTARFELTGASPITACSPGTPNMEIAGLLTIKETTLPFCFPAIIAIQDDGSIKAQASIQFDRTLWNVCYGSGKMFERLGMHLVNDLVSVELFIVARTPAIAAC